MRRFTALVLVVPILLVVPALSPSARAAAAPGVTTRLGAAHDVVLSADGRTAAFTSTAALDPLAVAGRDNVYVRDVASGAVLVVARGADGGAADGASRSPSLSANGRYVVFETTATNLGTADTDAYSDVVVCDRDPDGDGVLDERTDDQVDHDCTRAGRPPEAPLRFHEALRPVLDAGASAVLWVDRPINTSFARRAQSTLGDRLALTRLDKDAAGRILPPTTFGSVDVAPPGSVARGVGEPAVSADGRHAVVVANLDDEGDAIVGLSLDGAPPVRLDDGSTGQLSGPVISGDGRRVAYTAANRVVLVDRGDDGAVTSREVVSRDVSGAEVAGSTPSLSADGRYLAFVTAAPGVHDGDPGEFAAVVTRDLVLDERRADAGLPRLPAALTSPSIRTDCACAANAHADAPVLSSDGSSVAFLSTATDLVAGDEDGEVDAFVRTFTPGLVLAADPVRFPDADPVPVVVRHTGFGPLHVTEVRITGGFEVFPAETCSSAVLHQTGDCTVSVRLTEASDEAGRLEVVPATGPPVSVALVASSGPPAGAIDVQPSEVDFGTALTGSPGASRDVVVRNTGSQAVRVTGSTVVAGDRFFPGDYATSGSCDVLAGGASCVLQVRHTPQGPGDRPAVLQIEHTAQGGRALVLLSGRGAPASVAASPAVGRPGSVVMATGTGFPAGQQVVVRFAEGAERVTATAGPDGTFRAPLLVFRGGRPGVRVLTATSSAGAPPVSATTPVLVQPGSVAPPDLVSRR